MYEYKRKDKDITSLSVSFKDFVPSADEITQDELSLVTSDALNPDLTEEQLTDLKKRFKKIKYTILDHEMNRKGFGLTENAMKTFVEHFHATKKDSDLHSFFKDHDYGKIDSMLGRIVDRQYDAESKRVISTALIDTRTDVGKRLDMFKNLSTTLLHGKPICSECNLAYMSCDHDAFPRSTVAYGIEDSLVTQSAYPNAKRTGLSMFQSSLSAIDIAKDLFENQEKEEPQIAKETKEETKKEDELQSTGQTNPKKEEKKVKEEIADIKESIEFLKKYVDNEILY